MANSLFDDSCVHHLRLDVYFRNNNNQISSGKRLTGAFILGTNHARQVRTIPFGNYSFIFSFFFIISVRFLFFTILEKVVRALIEGKLKHIYRYLKK